MIAGFDIIEAKSGIPPAPPIPGKLGNPAGIPPAPLVAGVTEDDSSSSSSSFEALLSDGTRDLAVAREDFMVAFYARKKSRRNQY